MNYTTRFFGPEDFPKLHPAFLSAFSDYSLNILMSEEPFKVRFRDKLGLQEGYSPGVFQDDHLVAFIFSAVADYQGQLTAYNGGTGVDPDHRGKKLVDEMYALMLPKLQADGIEQCVLEVLTDNAKAIRAYQRVGFTQGDFLRCFKLQDLPTNFQNPVPDLKIILTQQPTWESYASWSDAHATFQDQWPRLEHNPHEEILEAYWQGEKAGVAVHQPHVGRISAIAVAPAYRGKRIGAALVAEMVKRAAQPNLTFINIREQSEGMRGFLTRLNFANQVNQYEMRLSV
ncbi:MAG: GNAT family N-acetyltransferase [Bacteroidota bacterium]